jgi:hypothetical protein
MQQELDARGAMRFFYVIKPVLGQWEVSFGEHGSRFLYHGRDEAMQVAKGAAKQQWETHRRPSGVRLELPDGTQEVANFGNVCEPGETSAP